MLYRLTMTLNELEDLLATISYKPGYLFKVLQEESYDLVSIRFSYFAKDAENPENIISLVSKTTLVLPLPEKEVVLSEIKLLIKTAELHEMNEWLKVDGKHLTDPHPEYK